MHLYSLRALRLCVRKIFPRMPVGVDDVMLELAFAAGCRYIIAHNVGDFEGSEQLGVAAISPRDFLRLMRAQA